MNSSNFPGGVGAAYKIEEDSLLVPQFDTAKGMDQGKGVENMTQMLNQDSNLRPKLQGYCQEKNENGLLSQALG